MRTLNLFDDLPATGLRNPLREARAIAAAAIERVAGRNEDANPGWTDLAVERLRKFARHAPGQWSMEQAREVIAGELPEPTDLRTWGSVTRLAIQRGIIVQARGVYVAAVSSNGSAKPAYRKGPKA